MRKRAVSAGVWRPWTMRLRHFCVVSGGGLAYLQAVLSPKPWKLESVLFLAAGIMISLSTAGLIGYALHHRLPDLDPSRKPYLDFLLTTVGFHGASLAFVAVFLYQHGTSWRQFLGLGRPRPGILLLQSALTLGFALPVAIGLNLLSAWLLVLAGFEPVEQASVRMLQDAQHWDHLALFGFAAIVTAPVCEECLFRGILYPFLKHRFQPAFGLWMSSLLFATIHANAMTFIPLTVFAILLVQLYERTDTLLAPILTHALFNAANFALLVSGWDPFPHSAPELP